MLGGHVSSDVETETREVKPRGEVDELRLREGHSRGDAKRAFGDVLRSWQLGPVEIASEVPPLVDPYQVSIDPMMGEEAAQMASGVINCCKEGDGARRRCSKLRVDEAVGVVDAPIVPFAHHGARREDR